MAETSADLEVELFEAEVLALGRAVAKRRSEFVAGRACARRALAALGFGPTPVGAGPHGEPLWPPGVVGSITHTAGYRACAVAHRDRVGGLGIDAERDVRLDPGVWEVVAHGRERDVREAPGPPHLDAVLFSAKEAVYKAWFPRADTRLGFGDAEVSIDARASSFRVRLHGGDVAEHARLTGRWAAGGGLVLTAVLL